MTRSKKPVVLHLKKWKAILTEEVPQKKWPEPVHCSRQDGPPVIRKEVDPDSIRTAWVAAFGPRLRIDDQRGFYLDGSPISLDALMLATNRIRKAHGQDPVGRKPEWLP